MAKNSHVRILIKMQSYAKYTNKGNILRFICIFLNIRPLLSEKCHILFCNPVSKMPDFHIAEENCGKHGSFRADGSCNADSRAGINVFNFPAG